MWPRVRGRLVGTGSLHLPWHPRDQVQVVFLFFFSRGSSAPGASGPAPGLRAGGRDAERVRSSAAATLRPRSAFAPPTVSSREAERGLRRAGEPPTRLSAAGSAVGVREGGRRPPRSARGPRAGKRRVAGPRSGRGAAGAGSRSRRGDSSGAGPCALRSPLCLGEWARCLRCRVCAPRR